MIWSGMIIHILMQWWSFIDDLVITHHDLVMICHYLVMIRHYLQSSAPDLSGSFHEWIIIWLQRSNYFLMLLLSSHYLTWSSYYLWGSIIWHWYAHEPVIYHDLLCKKCGYKICQKEKSVNILCIPVVFFIIVYLGFCSPVLFSYAWLGFNKAINY